MRRKQHAVIHLARAVFGPVFDRAILSALVLLSSVLLSSVLFSSRLAAQDSITGTFEVTLEGPGDISLGIGLLELSEDSHEFEPDENLFTNHFLSMRPFRCFNQDKVMWCYLPYPYEKPAEVSADDMRSLEYDLLFIHRSANDYGIDAWNGLYFKVVDAKGGATGGADGDNGGNVAGEIVGELREVDLNILASPPENGIVWPITDEDLHVDESDRHVFNRVRLSPR